MRIHECHYPAETRRRDRSVARYTWCHPHGSNYLLLHIYYIIIIITHVFVRYATPACDDTGGIIITFSNRRTYKLVYSLFICVEKTFNVARTVYISVSVVIRCIKERLLYKNATHL